MYWRMLIPTTLCAGLMSIASGAEAPPRLRHMTFEVFKEGRSVGHQRINIVRNGEQTNVVTKTEWTERFALIPIHSFEQIESEVLRRDRLVTLHSWTNDDGDVHKLDASLEGDRIVIQVDGVKHDARQDALPESAWNKAITTKAELLDKTTGNPLAVSVEDLGDEEIMTQGAANPSRHFRIRGDHEYDVWYDADHELSQMRGKTKTGAMLTFIRTQVSP